MGLFVEKIPMRAVYSLHVQNLRQNVFGFDQTKVYICEIENFSETF